MSDTSGARERSLSWSDVISAPVYFSKLLQIEGPSLSLGAVDWRKVRRRSLSYIISVPPGYSIIRDANRFTYKPVLSIAEADRSGTRPADDN